MTLTIATILTLAALAYTIWRLCLRLGERAATIQQLQGRLVGEKQRRLCAEHKRDEAERRADELDTRNSKLIMESVEMLCENERLRADNIQLRARYHHRKEVAAAALLTDKRVIVNSGNVMALLDIERMP